MLIQAFEKVNFPTPFFREQLLKAPEHVQRDITLQPCNISHCKSHGNHHITQWKPNTEDLERLNRGEGIYFIVHFDGGIASVQCQMEEPRMEQPKGLVAMLYPETREIWSFRHKDKYPAYIEPTTMLGDVEVYGLLPEDRRTEGNEEHDE